MSLSISIITVVFNNAASIADCLGSVANQTHSAIEHIIIDGVSTDGTLEVIRKWQGESGKGQGSRTTNVISEPDKGIYDALNKGITMAGGDIIGILHSDDVFADENVVSRVVNAMVQQNVESCYADIVYVDRGDTSKVVRSWRSGAYEKRRFHYGWMPPHPTFFVKKSVYEKYGLLNLDFPLAADYELMLRFLYKHEISTTYIPEVLVKMRTGGTSRPGMYTIKSILENYRAWKMNALPYPPTMLLKPFSKVFQYVKPATG